MVFRTKIKTLLKSFCVIVFICLALFSLTACSKSKLDAPDTFSINESILSWNAVENAEKYIVRINDVDVYETSEESFDISFISNGVNKIQVKAKENDNYKQSDFGEALYINKLSAPTNIQLYGNKIRWSTVDGAESYSVKLYNSNYEVVFETISNSNNISFETIQSIIYSTPNYCILGISSNGKGQHSVLEDNTIIFATISSSFNTGYVINFENKMPKPDLIKLNKTNQSFEWTLNYINNKYNIEITDSDGKIIFKEENHSGASITMEELSLETHVMKSGKYKIRITALKP